MYNYHGRPFKEIRRKQEIPKGTKVDSLREKKEDGHE